MSKKNKGKKYFIVYEITNLNNGHFYIGKYGTYTPYDMKNYWGSGLGIKLAIKKYGRKNFKRETLHVFENEKDAYTKEEEILTVDMVKSNKCYNQCGGGKGVGSGETHPRKGKRHLTETLEKMSIAKVGENHPLWGIKGEDNPNFGRKASHETKKKQSVAMSGENHWVFGMKTEDNPNFGSKRSEHTKKKQSDAAKGRTFTVETRIKLAISILGKEVFYRRLKDIKEIDRVYGWKAKLTRMWGISHGNINRFLKHWDKSNIKNS